MKKINFKKIYLSYFLSTGEKVEHNFEDGITFVRGLNKTEGQKDQNNGVGKTAIFLDGLVYALYGTTSRNLKKAEIPFNRGGKKKCIVELQYDYIDGDITKEVTITRMINPSKFTLVVDGEDVSNSNASATQEYLLKELLGGIKKEVFQHSIAMKIDSTTPFMSMNKVERDKFIGGIFDLSYLKEAEKLAREQYNETSKEVGKKEVKYNTALPQLTSVKDQVRVLIDQDKKRKIQRELDIKSLENEISGIIIGDKPVEINLELEESDINEKIDKLKGFKHKIESDIQAEKDRVLLEQQKEREEKFLEEQKVREAQMLKEQEERQKLFETEQEKKRIDSEIKRLQNEIKLDEESMSCSKCGRDYDEESKEVIRQSITEKECEISKLIHGVSR